MSYTCTTISEWMKLNEMKCKHAKHITYLDVHHHFRMEMFKTQIKVWSKQSKDPNKHFNRSKQ